MGDAAAGERRGRNREHVVFIIGVCMWGFAKHMATLVEWGLRERLAGFSLGGDKSMSLVDRVGAGQGHVKGALGWAGNGCSIVADRRTAGLDGTTLGCRMTGLVTVGVVGTGIAPWQHRGVCAADGFVW